MTIDMNGRALVFAIAGLIVGLTDLAIAQSNQARFELGGHVSSTMWSQFDHNDVGFGGRFGWRPLEPVGIESEITFYPRDFPDRVPFSRGRVEALFGVTAGPRFGRLRPFARLRSGFLNVREAPQPI